MAYYIIDILGDLHDPSLCVLDSPPKGLGVKYYRMAKGKRIGRHYPRKAAIYMSDKYPGIKVASLIGNTESYLIVAQEVKETIEEHCPSCDIEYLPFTLYNHKKRIHSEDYFIVNPIGTLDCLDLEASQIEYLNGDVVGVDQFVLDPAKVEQAPALFRIKEDPRKYVINESLAESFVEKGFTNMLLEAIPQKETS